MADALWPGQAAGLGQGWEQLRDEPQSTRAKNQADSMGADKPVQSFHPTNEASSSYRWKNFGAIGAAMLLALALTLGITKARQRAGIGMTPSKPEYLQPSEGSQQEFSTKELEYFAGPLKADKAQVTLEDEVTGGTVPPPLEQQADEAEEEPQELAKETVEQAYVPAQHTPAPLIEAGDEEPPADGDNVTPRAGEAAGEPEESAESEESEEETEGSSTAESEAGDEEPPADGDNMTPRAAEAAGEPAESAESEESEAETDGISAAESGAGDEEPPADGDNVTPRAGEAAGEPEEPAESEESEAETDGIRRRLRPRPLLLGGRLPLYVTPRAGEAAGEPEESAESEESEEETEGSSAAESEAGDEEPPADGDNVTPRAGEA
ncbi:hypothetical protein, conserved, partial [Eimeria necatrix]